MKLKEAESRIEFARKEIENFIDIWKKKWTETLDDKPARRPKHEMQFNVEAICITHICHYFVTKIMFPAYELENLPYDLGFLEELTPDDTEKIAAIESFSDEPIEFYEGDELFSGQEVIIPFPIRQRIGFPLWLDRDEFYRIIGAVNTAAASYRLCCAEFEFDWRKKVIEATEDEHEEMSREFFDALSELTDLRRQEFIHRFSLMTPEALLEEYGFIDSAADFIKPGDISLTKF